MIIDPRDFLMLIVLLEVNHVSFILEPFVDVAMASHLKQLLLASLFLFYVQLEF